MKRIKKYKTSLIGLGGLILGDIIAVALYLCCLSISQTAANASALEIAKNVLVILISVLSSSLISIPLIEVREKNALCRQILMGDVLSERWVSDALPEEQKKTLLRNLESSIYFDADPVKESMYASIRKKISGQSPKTDYYLTSCEYNVRCSIEGELIKKTVLKKVSIKSYKKMPYQNFPLCVTAFQEMGEKDFLQISRLTVNGRECDLKNDICSKKVKQKDVLAQKSGYTATMQHWYSGKLQLSPSKPSVIEVEYTTVVPKNDKSYICRVGVPCQRFKFSFVMDGESQGQYRVALNAFGFIDDGHSTPNHHDDAPSVSVELNDWIFPRDGVAVTILERSEVPAAV